MLGLVPDKTLDAVRFVGLLLIIAGIAVQKTNGFELPLLEGTPAFAISMVLGSLGIWLFILPNVHS